MRDPTRIREFCNVFADIWESVPDWRFGQLVVNTLGRDPFYIEDDEALARIKTHFNWSVVSGCEKL